MFRKLKQYRKERKWAMYAAVLFSVLVSLFLVVLLLFKMASLGAAGIFNYAVSKQKMLRGTITVEEITANIHGGVTFTNLAWDDPQGNPILRVPTGTLKVNPWDIVTRRMKSTTLEGITLNDPVFSVRYDENMQVDFVNPKEIEDNSEDGKANFNRNGKRLKMNFVLNNAKIQTFYLERHHIFNHVNMEMDLDTKGMTYISLTTGPFGGTAVGDGVKLYGTVDFSKPDQECHFDAEFDGIDPSSLGLGTSIRDRLTLKAHADGPFAGPIADGTLEMKRLRIPALRFHDVHGDIHYEGGLLTFSNVKAGVYGGRLLARGDYDIDSRAYNIYINAWDMDTRYPLKSDKFYCLVDLVGEMHCDGNPADLDSFGTFQSGSGFYMLAPFEKITGRFDNKGHILAFYDVKLYTKLGIAETDAFSIVKGRLHLGEIRLVDPDTGEAMRITDAVGEQEAVKTFRGIQQNMKEIKEQVDDFKDALKR